MGDHAGTMVAGRPLPVRDPRTTFSARIASPPSSTIRGRACGSRPSTTKAWQTRLATGSAREITNAIRRPSGETASGLGPPTEGSGWPMSRKASRSSSETGRLVAAAGVNAGMMLRHGGGAASIPATARPAASSRTLTTTWSPKSRGHARTANNWSNRRACRTAASSRSRWAWHPGCSGRSRQGRHRATMLVLSRCDSEA